MENTQKLKTTFFRKFIVSIFGIDKYDKISESTVSSFIGYIILLLVLVTLILTPAITRTEVGAMEVFKNFTQSNLPDFKVVDDKFEVDSEEPIIRTNKTDFDKMFDGTIILTNYANVEKEHKELLEKKGNLLVFSKDYLIIKQPKTAIVKYKYSSIAKQLGLPANFTKADTLKLLTDEKQNEILQKTLVFISIVILLTAVIIAIITSKIMKIQIKYSKLFNISCMSITLATIVFTIITAIMLLTRFNFIVPNLDLLYLILTYIYLVVALLLIRKREIGNQQELIIKQKIIIKKVEEQPEENRKDKEDKKDKKSDKDDKKEKENENNDNDNIVKDNT